VGAADRERLGGGASRPTPFSRCSKRQLRKLAGLAQFKEFAAGSLVIQAGDPSNAFYLILGGQARVLGKPRARLLRIGDYFGEMGLIDGEPRSASIAAGNELHVMLLPRLPFLRLLEQEPGIAVAMLGDWLDECAVSSSRTPPEPDGSQASGVRI
jgi:CRP/FNR family cyclic AMP-dependent transcriptional regulator